MAKVIFSVLFCIFAPSLVRSTPVSTEIQQNDVLERLKNNADFETIGQLGKKIFIKHNDATSSWMAGRALCQSAGLELASLKSYDEFRYVSLALIGTQTAAWVSGIMAGVEQFQPTGFVWDTDKTPIPNDINFMVISTNWLCLYYSGDDHTYVDSCLNGRHETLCQMVLP